MNRLIEEQLADGLPVPEPEPEPAPEVQIAEEVVNAEDIENNENETDPDIQESEESEEEELRQKLTDLTLKKPPASFFQSDFIGDIIYLTWLTVVTTAVFCILYLLYDLKNENFRTKVKLELREERDNILKHDKYKKRKNSV